MEEIPQKKLPTPKDRWEILQGDREPFLTTAREVASYSLPSLYPPSGTGSNSNLLYPWQSVNARCLTTLAARLTLVLTTPGTPHFRLSLSPQKAAQTDPKAAEEFNRAFSAVERRVMDYQESRSERVAIHEACLHLLVAGSSLLYYGTEGLRHYSLDEFCVVRDGEGVLTEIVIKECLTEETVPQEARDLLNAERDAEADDLSKKPSRPPNSPVDMYTRVYLEGSTWHEEQQVENVIFNKTTYPKDKLPYIAARWRKVDGQSYGRSMGEEHLGDFRAVDTLHKALQRYARQATKLVLLVNPNGVTSLNDIQEAADGAYVSGVPDDVKPITLEKAADVSIASQLLDTIVRRLELSFMVASAIQRDAERQTAFEYKFLASQIEAGLSGAYSMLARDLQGPLVALAMERLQSNGDLPALPKDLVDVKLITGIDALGRNEELTKLDDVIGAAVNTFGPQAVLEYIDIESFMRARASRRGVDIEGIIRTTKEVQEARAQAQQAAQQGALAQKAIGPGIAAVSKMMEQNGNQQNGSPAGA
jgi:hypothetical protein